MLHWSEFGTLRHIPPVDVNTRSRPSEYEVTRWDQAQPMPFIRVSGKTRDARYSKCEPNISCDHFHWSSCWNLRFIVKLRSAFLWDPSLKHINPWYRGYITFIIRNYSYVPVPKVSKVYNWQIRRSWTKNLMIYQNKWFHNYSTHLSKFKQLCGGILLIHLHWSFWPKARQLHHNFVSLSPVTARTFSTRQHSIWFWSKQCANFPFTI